MALTDLHVNGPAKVRVALTGGSYTDLGYTEDGVEISPQVFHEDVQSDDYGPAMPADVQFMGAEFRISLPMVRWDATVMNAVLAWLRSGSTFTFGMTDIGTLMVSNGKYMGLQISGTARSSGTTEPTHTFTYAWPIGDQPLKVGTRVSRHRLTFRAIFVNGVLATRA